MKIQLFDDFAAFLLQIFRFIIKVPLTKFLVLDKN